PPLQEKVQLASPAHVIGQAPDVHAASQLPPVTHEGQSPVSHSATHIVPSLHASDGSAGFPPVALPALPVVPAVVEAPPLGAVPATGPWPLEPLPPAPEPLPPLPSFPDEHAATSSQESAPFMQSARWRRASVQS